MRGDGCNGVGAGVVRCQQPATGEPVWRRLSPSSRAAETSSRATLLLLFFIPNDREAEAVFE